MHELSIVESMVSTADSFAREHDIKNVKKLTVQVGALTGVVPRYLTMYYGDVTEGTSLEGSELEIEEIPAEAFCRGCGEVFNPEETEEKCPACGYGSYDVLHGKELTIKEIAYI